MEILISVQKMKKEIEEFETYELKYSYNILYHY